VDSKIQSHGAWGLPAEPLDDSPDIGASLIMVALLSLGLWGAIWVAVASFASAILG